MNLNTKSTTKFAWLVVIGFLGLEILLTPDFSGVKNNHP
jgi:hypothetical protein